MWLYFYTCKYTSNYRNKQIHLNIFSEKNKKIRKQKYNKIYIFLHLYLFIYLHVYTYLIIHKTIYIYIIKTDRNVEKIMKNNILLYICII